MEISESVYSDYLCGSNPVRSSRDLRVAAVWRYKHWTANFQNDGGWGQSRTGNGQIGNPLFYLLELSGTPIHY